jgi:transposase
MIESLQRQVKSLQAEVEELRARLKRDSSNSSQPPSSDPPWKAPPKRGKGRKRGGQPGHSGRTRALVEPDHIEDYRPSACDGCGHRLAGDDPRPFRHQVTEIPEVRAKVTEHRVHSLECEHCGEKTTAELPPEISLSSFGPRLQAIIAVCSGAYRMSKRSTEELVRDFFGVELALGTISNIEQYVSAALEGPMQDALEHLKNARAVHLDETSWFQRACRAWLWTAVTARVSVFLIRPRRTKSVALELIARWFRGTAITDRYPGYDWIPAERHQLCWAHLIRDFRELLDFEASKAFAEALLDAVGRMFETWHRVRDGTVAEVTAALAASRDDIHGLLSTGRQSEVGRVRKLCEALLRREVSLWTFTRRHDVEPTNNAAERALRPGVLWRKSSFGTDSEKGSRFVERILTVVQTLRRQGRHVLGYITEACRSFPTGAPALPIWHP